MATATTELSDLKRFHKIRDRVNDVFGTSADAIARGDYVHVTGRIFDEETWLVQENERLGVPATHKKKFDGIVSRLKVIRRRHGPQIKTGEHLRVQATLFREMRWLIVLLEQATGEPPAQDDPWEQEGEQQATDKIDIPADDLDLVPAGTK